jgi:hypothetical protein
MIREARKIWQACEVTINRTHSLSYLLSTVIWLVRLGVGPPSGFHDQIFITFGHLWSSCRGAPSLTRGRICNVVYSYKSLSFSSPSPAELMTISYCLIWDYLVPLLFLRWRYSNPPPHGVLLCRVTYRLIAHKDMVEMVLNTYKIELGRTFLFLQIGFFQ